MGKISGAAGTNRGAVDVLFLAEAQGHAAAEDVCSPSSRQMLIAKGDRIGPREVALLARNGIDRVRVHRKPRISILVIGEGLAMPGTAQTPGRDYDFGSTAIKAELETLKIRPVFARQIPYEPKKIGRVASFAVNQSDMVIFVVKEIEKGLRGLRSVLKELRTASPIPVFILPYDMERIFEEFEHRIRPAILSFMGCVQRGA